MVSHSPATVRGLKILVSGGIGFVLFIVRRSLVPDRQTSASGLGHAISNPRLGQYLFTGFSAISEKSASRRPLVPSFSTAYDWRSSCVMPRPGPKRCLGFKDRWMENLLSLL